ncbi:MAG: sulfurtransferase TusA family protein [Nitrospirae bacterium]|nr:MAG: sulfurtransferase TusA family protein [Nitrospirota bacterium]
MAADAELDTFGMLCPMPIYATSQKLKELAPGQVLRVLADDKGLLNDLPAWCAQTGNECLGVEEVEPGEYVGYVRKA